MGKTGVSGFHRRRDSLIRITIAIAKLKLKNVAEEEDAEEAVLFYNDTLKHFNQDTKIDAKDLAHEEIKEIIKEYNGFPMSFIDAVKLACERNLDVRYYLLGKDDQNIDDLKLSNNWHLKQILRLLRKDDCIQVVQEKPIMMRWKGENEDQKP